MPVLPSCVNSSTPGAPEPVSDYHLHLHPHVGGERPGDPPQGEYPTGLIEAYVEEGAERGIAELGFTEHLYRCREAADVLGRFWEYDTAPDLADLSRVMFDSDLTLSLEDYVEAVVGARDRGLGVKLGLEVDFFPETFEAVLELIEPYPWDYLIGAVHWIRGWTIDASHSSFEFERRGIARAWAEYFELETRLAASGSVDVLAHVDVIKKYGHRPEVDLMPWYRSVVEAASASGTAVEVSSQGLRNPAREVYPAPQLLAMFCQADVPITLASDGHHASQVGWGRDEVVEAARTAGYSTHLSFDRGVPSRRPL